jgi:hypothetical protein
MNAHASPTERRHHPRIFLGVPVRVHLAGEPRSLTLELVDVSASGSYFRHFRPSGRRPRIGQYVAFGFVMAERSVCTACGRVVRTDAQGFALKLERANHSFHGFVDDISGAFMRAA